MDMPLPVEAEIIHDLPDPLNALIGRIAVGHSKIEYKLTSLSALLLQLNKAEARIALRMPRLVDRLDMALDLFAIRGIGLMADTTALRTLLETAATRRDAVIHGLWLQHPDSGEIYLRLSRGAWPKDLTGNERISRTIYPQSVIYGEADCQETLRILDECLTSVDQLGAALDQALNLFPDRFREPSPLINPLGSRASKRPQAQRGASHPKPRKK